MRAILSAFNASYKIPPPSKASHANHFSQRLELWLLKQQWVVSSWSCSRTPRTSCYPPLTGSSCGEAPQGARLSQLPVPAGAGLQRYGLAPLAEMAPVPGNKLALGES